ncbi:hypothetical protein OUZ56_022003 [Daphnia magna]|uniref:Uncharacterized protein n=1 Tax=Daphnia magna TaxID=35525 RepID=A0ABR0AV41_9CRUS|nr:hypothetical protein OUZ56_022003 [Daphnia magna]
MYRVAPPRSRDEVYSRIVRLREMEMVRAFTTRLPVVGATGTTLQRNITIYVLVAGIAGGLLLILAILLLCKYCSRLRSRTNRGENTANPVVRERQEHDSFEITLTCLLKGIRER